MSTDETPDPARSRRRRNTILGITGALVVLLLIAAGLWAANAPKGPGSSPTPGATPSASSGSSSSPSPGTSSSSPSASATPVPSTSPGATPDPSLDSNAEIPVPYKDPQPVTPALSIKVSSVKAVQGTADEPGEIAGPSLQFTVDFVNSSDQAISLRDVAINVDYGKDQTPAIELRMAQTHPVAAEVAAKSTESGTYVFNVPEKGRDQVRLLVFTSVDNPVIAFSGPAPR